VFPFPGTWASKKLRREIQVDSLFLGIGNPVACYEMKDELYPNTSVSKNAQK
jgi:hypothetical protein